MSAPNAEMRGQYDSLLVDIARYVDQFAVDRPEALATARIALMDSIGCGLEALQYPECCRRPNIDPFVRVLPIQN